METRPHTPQNSRLQIERGLRSCQVFADWPEGRLRELSALARMQHYGRRTQLLRGIQKQDVLVIVSGSIEVCATNAAGNKYILAVQGAGQVSRLVQLESASTIFTYYAREDTQIIHIPAPALKAVLDAEPILWRSIAQLMMRRFRFTIEVLQGQALGSVRRRIAVVLINMAHRYGDREIDPGDARLRISQTDLANMLGVSRQSVSKELGRLKDEGIIGDGEGYRLITLLDIPGLWRITKED